MDPMVTIQEEASPATAVPESDTDPRDSDRGDDQLPDSYSPPQYTERVQNTKRRIDKKVGSFIPITCFSFEAQDATPKEAVSRNERRRRRRVQEPKESHASREETVPGQSIFSENTKRYLKSSGLHSKRIERLLMKYLGPSSQEEDTSGVEEKESTTPCPSPQLHINHDKTSSSRDCVMCCEE